VRIRTHVILRLRDHLLEPARSSGTHAFSPVELADAILNRIHPFAEVMYLVIAADDVIEPAERSALLAALDILCDGAVGPDALAGLLERIEADSRVGDPEQRLVGATARLGTDRENRETAFLLAAAVALADDELEPREARVMTWARTYLGISERRLETLLASGVDPQP